MKLSSNIQRDGGGSLSLKKKKKLTYKTIYPYKFPLNNEAVDNDYLENRKYL